LELQPRAELAHVRGDRIHLANVFYNLIDNAVKYCETAPVVTLSTSSDAQGLTVSVKDNGIGIPKKAQQKIFERFFRVDKARSRQQGGAGLGLAIVKSIVEAHHGRVRLKSDVNVGSTFELVLPID
jgi:two-component system phosphate regulon sensor histidine kinase PhoR